MKEDIHPTYYPEATVICACGNTWKTGSTQETIRTDVCSACHPFFTGEQRIVDTEGQVDRFYKKLKVHEEYEKEKQARERIKHEWLPRIQRELDKLKEKLKQYGREDELAPLEKEVERIRKI